MNARSHVEKVQSSGLFCLLQTRTTHNRLSMSLIRAMAAEVQGLCARRMASDPHPRHRNPIRRNELPGSSVNATKRGEHETAHGVNCQISHRRVVNIKLAFHFVC